MAKRRMFSDSVVGTDDFMEMPVGAKLLYFYFGMYADDDGFVDKPKQIMRTVNATEDDIRVLIAKKYVLTFDSGVIVIRHWRLNNYLRTDRYTETVHLEEKSQLKKLENGVYERVEENEQLGIPNGIPVVDTDKYSIDKYKYIYVQNEHDFEQDFTKNEQNLNKNEQLSPKNEPKLNEKDTKWHEMFELFYSEYPKKQAKDRTRQWFLKNKPNEQTFEHIMFSLNKFKQTYDWKKQGGQFIPMPSTFLNQKRWKDFDFKDEVKTKKEEETVDWDEKVDDNSYIETIKSKHRGGK